MKFLSKIIHYIECAYFHWVYHDLVVIVQSRFGTSRTYKCFKCGRTWETY